MGNPPLDPVENPPAPPENEPATTPEQPAPVEEPQFDEDGDGEEFEPKPASE